MRSSVKVMGYEESGVKGARRLELKQETKLIGNMKLTVIPVGVVDGSEVRPSQNWYVCASQSAAVESFGAWDRHWAPALKGVLD